MPMRGDRQLAVTARLGGGGPLGAAARAEPVVYPLETSIYLNVYWIFLIVAPSLL
jgi:hypothetical protein